MRTTAHLPFLHRVFHRSLSEQHHTYVEEAVQEELVRRYVKEEARPACLLSCGVGSMPSIVCAAK